MHGQQNKELNLTSCEGYDGSLFRERCRLMINAVEYLVQNPGKPPNNVREARKVTELNFDKIRNAGVFRCISVVYILGEKKGHTFFERPSSILGLRIRNKIIYVVNGV